MRELGKLSCKEKKSDGEDAYQPTMLTVSAKQVRQERKVTREIKRQKKAEAANNK